VSIYALYKDELKEEWLVIRLIPVFACRKAGEVQVFLDGKRRPS